MEWFVEDASHMSRRRCLLFVFALTLGPLNRIDAAVQQSPTPTIGLGIPTANPSEFRPVNRLVDIGKPGTPVLSDKQMLWVSKIRRSKYWQTRMRHLWFFLGNVGGPRPDDPPLVVFYSAGEPNSLGATYQIVGVGCGIVFTRYTAVDSVFLLPPMAFTEWPIGCNFDPLARNQRDDFVHPPVPPTLPP